VDKETLDKIVAAYGYKVPTWDDIPDWVWKFETGLLSFSHSCFSPRHGRGSRIPSKTPLLHRTYWQGAYSGHAALWSHIQEEGEQGTHQAQQCNAREWQYQGEVAAWAVEPLLETRCLGGLVLLSRGSRKKNARGLFFNEK